MTNGSPNLSIGGNVDGNIFVGDNNEINISIPTSFPAVPPAPPKHFAGRKSEIERFATLLTSGGIVATTALHGMGGIGKTALAQKLAERVKDQFKGGILWWTLGEKPDVFTALDSWARLVDPNADLKTLTDVSACANVVRSMLAHLGQLCAIIDDVWDYESAKILIDAIPSGCPVLITTRDGDLAKALRCRVELIDRLNEEECLALLTNLLGVLDDQESSAREIAQLTEGLPLAIELVAGLADSPTDLSRLTNQLKEQQPLDVLNLGVGEWRETNIERCFALSYNALDSEMQKRFRALGSFAPLSTFDINAITSIWFEDGLTSEIVEKSIHRFVRCNLLTLIGDVKRYKQHPLLRDYAYKLLLDRQKEIYVFGLHALHYFNVLRFAQNLYFRGGGAIKHGLGIFDIEWANIEMGQVWVSRYSTMGGPIADLCEYYASVGLPLLHLRLSPQYQKLWLEAALIANRYSNNHHHIEMQLSGHLGNVYLMLGEPQKALEYYEKILSTCRDSQDKLAEIICLSGLGNIYLRSNDFQKANQYFLDALSIATATDEPRAESVVLNNLGITHHQIGQNDRALEYQERSLHITQKLGDRYSEGQVLMHMGDTFRALEKNDNAVNCYEQARIIFGDLENFSSEHDALARLITHFALMNDWTQVVSYAKTAVRVLEKIRDRSLDEKLILILEILKKYGEHQIQKNESNGTLI